MRLFVTAIGTGCGKTIVSAVICEALQADYWKPVQAGTEETDSETVKSLVSNSKTVIHPEKYKLKTPASPHYAAKVEGIEISLNDFELPQTANHLVIEGAGGILVPLNEKGDVVIDLAARFNDVEVILVSNIYLGSINHTMLTINELKRREIKIKGIVFNGEANKETENIILKLSGLPCLLTMEQEKEMTPETVKHYARLLNLQNH